MGTRCIRRGAQHALAVVVTATAITTLGAGAAAAEGPNAVRTDPAFTANSLARNDDGSTVQVPAGFALDFFGATYNQVYVNNNGNITFDGPLLTFTPFGLNPNGIKIIAPFFGDVDTRGAGSDIVRYGYGTGIVNGHLAFGVNWVNVGYYSFRTDKLNSFQLVLIQREDTGSPSNFDIEFNYDKLQWETGGASGGVNGLGGESARVGYSSGSGEAYEFPTSGVDGSLLDTNLTTGLIYHSLNSTQIGRYVLQVRNGVVLPPSNNAPVAAAGADVSGGEGSAIAVDGSGSTDADGDALTYSWTAASDAGNDAGSACTFADAGAASTTITCNDDGTYTATLEVSDGEASSTDSAEVSVANVDPAISALALSGNTGTACLAGNATTLAFTLSDDGANDAGDLGGTVDWGDGTSEPYSGSSFSRNHSYGPGTYTVLVTAADGDGGSDSRSGANGVQHLYEAGGLMSPVNADGSSVFKLGSTVPLKIVVRDCNGVLVSTLSPDVDLTRVDMTPDGPVNEVISSSAADSGDDMRWSTDKYIYNLSTKRSQFCQTGTPYCSSGNLTQGTYEVRVTDSAAKDSFAAVVGRFNIKQ